MKWPVPSWRWHTDCWDSPIVYLCWVWGWKVCTTWLVEGRHLSISNQYVAYNLLCCLSSRLHKKEMKEICITEDKMVFSFYQTLIVLYIKLFFRSRVSSTLKDRSMFEVCHHNYKDITVQHTSCFLLQRNSQ